MLSSQNEVLLPLFHSMDCVCEQNWLTDFPLSTEHPAVGGTTGVGLVPSPVKPWTSVWCRVWGWLFVLLWGGNAMLRPRALGIQGILLVLHPPSLTEKLVWDVKDLWKWEVSLSDFLKKGSKNILIHRRGICKGRKPFFAWSQKYLFW